MIPRMLPMPRTTRPIDDGDFALTQSEAAILANCTVQTLINWRKKENPPPFDNEQKTYPAKAFGAWLSNRRAPVTTATTMPEGEAEVSKMRREAEARKVMAQALAAERENDVAAKRLVVIEEVESGWQEILSLVRTRLRQIPYTLAPEIAPDTDNYSVTSKLKEAIDEALTELSSSALGADDE